MVDYSKAKIYRILNNKTEDVYIGATCQPLSVRMAGHRKVRCYEKFKNYKLYQTMNEIGIEHFYIELVKETPCENKEQLRSIEGEYIRQYATLNKRIEGRTKKQYTKDNKEKKAEYDKKRRQEQGDEINQKRRDKYNNDEEHKEKRKEQNAQNYQKHKEKYIDIQKERIECPKCGKELSRGFLREHLQTQHG